MKIIPTLSVLLIASPVFAADTAETTVLVQQMQQCQQQTTTALKSCRPSNCTYRNAGNEQMMAQMGMQRQYNASYTVAPAANGACDFQDKQDTNMTHCTLSVPQRQQLADYLQLSQNPANDVHHRIGEKNNVINGQATLNVYKALADQGVCKSQ